MKESKIAGIIGTLLLHVLLMLFLWWYTLSLPPQQEEGGVPVMLGNTELAQGDADPYTMTEVDVLPQPEAEVPEEVPVSPEPEVKQPLITQHEESSVKVKKEEPKKKAPKKKEEKKVEKKKETPKEVKHEKPKEQPKEKTEAEKRAEAERAAAAAASSKIAGAFGKGSKMGSKGDGQSGTGIQGSPTGNSGAGKTTGVGVSGEYELGNGRKVGPGGLPKPIYNVQDEGRVVVTIVVDPQGRVIRTGINKQTNTVNQQLQKAAEDAARKARFNTISGVDNQSGTITYYFNLK